MPGMNPKHSQGGGKGGAAEGGMFENVTRCSSCKIVIPAGTQQCGACRSKGGGGSDPNRNTNSIKRGVVGYSRTGYSILK